MKVTLVFLCALLGLSAAASMQGRIVGGHNAAAGQYPYMASLRNTADAHFCGGWIHNTRWIVSAAHCTVGRNANNVVAVVGTNSLESGGVVHRPISIVNHPNFNANTLGNDVSLIWTSEVIITTPFVRSIPLSAVNTGSGVHAVATGFGLIRHPGYLAETLQWLSVVTITNFSCRSDHSLANRSRINDSNLCTANTQGSGLCTGDDGSPLVAGSAVIGSFSWGIPCATGLPDVYTRMASHRAWIHGVAGEHE